MAAAGFSEDGNSDPNVMQCTTCSLLIYGGYFTPEPLKKHLHEAPHCPLAIQLQQEVQSKKAAKLKAAEKPKIEPPSAPALPVKSLSTYEERLASFQYWIWKNSGPTKELMAAAGFRCTDDGYRARCMHCSLKIAGNRNFEPLKKHLQESPECPFVLQLEATKPTPVAADIGFFDATLACDIQEFNLFSEAAGFLQQLRQCQHQYRESDLLALLPDCLRGPALAWYKEQSESETAKKSLSEWLEALATAFPAKPPAKSEVQASAPNATPLLTPPPQYHSCLNCFASFSSLARLLQHTQTACRKAVCKHCEGAFESKNKLHEHIRQHHTKEVVKDASRRSFNRERDKISTTSQTTSQTTPPTTSSKTTPKLSISRPVTPPERPRNPPTPPATPAAIAPATSKRSHLPLSTPKPTPEPAGTASVDCPITPPATSPSMLRKSTSKPYLTIHDLHRMFAGKPRPFGLQQHQKRRLSPQSPGARPPTTYQSRITAYFLPAANQKAPISQGLKSSNPKSFQQHTPAESIPPCPRALPEKSALSPYKKPGISSTVLQSRSSFLQSRSSPRSSFAWPRPTFPPTSPPSSGSPPPDLPVCCTCFGHSSFHNGLFDYRRLRHRYPSNRRPRGGGMVG